MTPKEIIVANIEHTGASRPGMTFDRERINDINGIWVGAPDNYTQKKWIEGNREFYDDIYGNIWVRMVEGSVKGEIYKPVLQDWSQLDSLKMPKYNVEKLTKNLKQKIAENKNQTFNAVGIGGWIFDNARYIRDMEVYFMDMLIYPDELKTLHSKIVDVYEQKIHAAGKAGADAIMIGEDMGTQTGLLFSPDMFREFFKPDYTRLMGIAHEYGMKVLMHSCGKNWEIIDDLIDAGVDCFQFDQPAVYDMEALAAKFRERKVALWSPLDIQKVLPTGDESFIKAETKKMCEIFEGCLITKNYPDLLGIGVKKEWDDWAYDEICKFWQEN
ncbi:MAG: hypothetical protein PF692_02915 [Kiritimatiellae bacterium]|jgi:uroporphyrinogen decarboxylase|nr:hypothetical protein [Kiritimatiellia bacterium]